MTTAAIATSWLLIPTDVGLGAALVQGAAVLGMATLAMETEGVAITGLVEEAAAVVVEEAVMPADTIHQSGSNTKPLWGVNP